MNVRVSRLLYLLLFIACVWVITSCGSDADKKHDIYVLGYNKPQNRGVAYWKNGEEFPINDGGEIIYVNGIVVDGDDVYIYGVQNPTNKESVATYWKNGTRVQLSNGTKSEGIRSMIISGGDVYASGYEKESSTFSWIPKYWKNGAATLLPHAAFCGAEGIAVTGSDVHVIGFESSQAGVYARYWKNGQLMPLTPEVNKLWFSGITTDGSDVYIAGSDYTIASPTSTAIYKAAYWKNGTEVNLGFGETAKTLAGGGDVYVIGDDDNLGQAGYWLNQTYHSILQGSGSIRPVAVDIAIAGGDVIVAGNSLRSSNNERLGGYLWVNDVAQAPFDGTNANIEVIGVAVSH